MSLVLAQRSGGNRERLAQDALSEAKSFAGWDVCNEYQYDSCNATAPPSLRHCSDRISDFTPLRLLQHMRTKVITLVRL